jgi:AraC-like DNA-binding protein
MTDFAASAMARLIAAGLRRQGIVLERVIASRDAHISLNDKRSLLALIESRYGIDTLLRIGDAVSDQRDDPAFTALNAARDPIDLILRWQRLERFIHSRHRIELNDFGADYAVLHHYSIHADEPPLDCEDVLVFGLLVALVESIGTTELVARPSEALRWTRRHGQWRTLPPMTGLQPFALWEFRWSQTVSDTDPRSSPPLEASVSVSLRALLSRDLCAAWRIEDAATALSMSVRTLQRRLKLEETGFQQSAAAVRVAHAATLLTAGEASFAEVGYVCGFSDQAHFSRAFKTATSFTPAQFRTAFAIDRSTTAD